MYPASQCRMNAKRFAQHHLACCIYISRDMALLPIWITSGSCFALIYPGTNDVPPALSRSRTLAIPSTMPTSSTSRVYLSWVYFISFLRSTRTDRKFLNIGWKRYCNLIRKFTVGERRALPESTLFPLFFPCVRFTATSDGNNFT